MLVSGSFHSRTCRKAGSAFASGAVSVVVVTAAAASAAGTSVFSFFAPAVIHLLCTEPPILHTVCLYIVECTPSMAPPWGAPKPWGTAMGAPNPISAAPPMRSSRLRFCRTGAGCVPPVPSNTAERAASVVQLHLQGAHASRKHHDGTPMGCEDEADSGWRVMRLLPLLPPATPKLVTAAPPPALELPAMAGIAYNAAPTVSQLLVDPFH